jgi:hypothetical protein
MKTIKLLAVVCISATLLSSCQKGSTGPAGAAGANGVANISSTITSITPGSWSNPGTGEYLVKVNNSALTSADQDGVEVFVSTSTGIYLGLPTTNILANGDQMEFAYQTGAVSLIYLNSSAPASTINMKVVVIPPAIMHQHPNTNWKNYNEVKAILNLNN